MEGGVGLEEMEDVRIPRKLQADVAFAKAYSVCSML